MKTRSAAKREDNFLKEDKEGSASGSLKRKLVTPKKKTLQEPVFGGWDVLPHGLGKKGDLFRNELLSTGRPLTNATRQNDLEAGIDTIFKRTSGLAKKIEPTTLESSIDSEAAGLAVSKFLHSELPRDHTRKSTVVKVEESPDAKQLPEQGTKKKRNAIDMSDDVINKVDDLISVSDKVAKTKLKKARNYGLTPGRSPFPHHPKPTPEDCEEVVRLLSKLHGEVEAPDVIPPPSMERAGCGEVPDLLDALMRTRLSASTTANNATLSLKGLEDKFGLRTSGIGKGSVNWEAVHKADLPTIVDAIKRGGLANVKGKSIKEILDTVYEQNCVRRDALVKEKKTGEPAHIPGAKNESEDQKDTEILNANEGLLSMDYVFEMSNEEAMEELTKLPGIGVKTASCVMLFCMKRSSFAVDTHVWRHCKWLGWVPETATRDQTFSHCEVRIPDHLKYPLHHLFLRHGKTCGRCRANTSSGSKQWDDTICPIEHLVNRSEAKKQVGYSPPKNTAAAGRTSKKGVKGKMGKSKGSETSESDIEMDYATGDDDE